MEQVKANTLSTIPLGRQGENLARQILFDVSGWESEYGPGSVELIAQRPGDETPYPVVTTRDGDSVVWSVTAADTLYPGDSGRCELRYYVGETLAKSRIWGTYVARAMDTPSETVPPEPQQGWVDQIIAVGAAAKASADAAKADADRAAALAAEVAEKAAQTAQDASDAAKAMEAAQTAQRLAEEAQRAAKAARTAAAAAQAAAEQSATDAAGAKKDAETAQKAAQDAAAAAAKALADIRTLYQEMQTWAQGVIQDVNAAGIAAVQSVQSAGDAQIQRVAEEGTRQTSNAKAQADAAAQSASEAAQSAQQAAESAAVYDDVVTDVNQLKQDLNEITLDGKNLFDSSKVTEGYFVNQNTGILTASASFKSSDYISIIPSTSYTISVKSLSVGTTAQIRYFQYDENKTPIASSGGINAVGKEITFVSADGAKYVRFSYVVYSSEVMLEKGESATEYEEYIGKYINPKKIDSYTKEQSDMRYCAVPEMFKINLPDKIYATVGIELNIYFDNIVDTHDTDYLFDVTCDKGMQLQRGYSYTPNSGDVGSYPITLSVTNNHGQTVEKTSTIIVTAETIFPEKTVKILILGDSTTAGGTTVEKIHKNFENTGITIQTIGTRGTAPYNHEGRSGWSAGTYLGYEEVGGVPNAFYNNGFDAPYYFSKNSIDFPDLFIINLGINDMFPYTKDAQMEIGISVFVNNINTMIASIKSASSSIKVGIALPIPPNYSQDAFGKAYKCGQTRMRYKRNNFFLVNKLIEEFGNKEVSDGIYLIPIYTNIDTVYNMGMEEIPVNARNTNTKYYSPILNGGVHPVESGYWQTADVYTGFIKATI